MRRGSRNPVRDRLIWWAWRRFRYDGCTIRDLMWVTGLSDGRVRAIIAQQQRVYNYTRPPQRPTGGFAAPPLGAPRETTDLDTTLPRVDPSEEQS